MQKLLIPAALVASLLAPQVQAFEVGDLRGVPVRSAPAVAVKQKMSEVDAKGAALQYAVDVAMPLALQDGLWDNPAPGVSRWRVQVFSANAKNLAFEFSHLQLPEGAELRIYDPQGAVAQGPYTAANLAADGALWTAMVPSDQVLIDVTMPERVASQFAFALGHVNHGFINVAKSNEVTAKAGSCNVDAICPQADNFGDQRRAEAMLTIANKFLCSGQLINNARNDGLPLLVTASHCQAASNAASVTAYFNYQASSCGGMRDGNLTQSITGSVALVNDPNADVTLLQLSAPPPAVWSPYFAGWDASGNNPQQGASFHHPGGTEKRVSLFNSGSNKTNVAINGNTVRAYGVRWAQGVTEPGSSGAGLYDGNKRMVGVLSGGTASCSSPNGTDYFGRLDVAYPNQLQRYLDPDNTGILAMNGRNSVGSAPSAQVPVSNSTGSGSVANETASPTKTGGGGGSFGLMSLAALLAALGRKRLAR